MHDACPSQLCWQKTIRCASSPQKLTSLYVCLLLPWFGKGASRGGLVAGVPLKLACCKGISKRPQEPKVGVWRCHKQISTLWIVLHAIFSANSMCWDFTTTWLQQPVSDTRLSCTPRYSASFWTSYQCVSGPLLLPALQRTPGWALCHTLEVCFKSDKLARRIRCHIRPVYGSRFTKSRGDQHVLRGGAIPHLL